LTTIQELCSDLALAKEALGYMRDALKLLEKVGERRPLRMGAIKSLVTAHDPADALVRSLTVDLQGAKDNRAYRLKSAPAKWVDEGEASQRACVLFTEGNSGGYVPTSPGDLSCDDEVMAVWASGVPWHGVVVEVDGERRAVKIAKDREA